MSESTKRSSIIFSAVQHQILSIPNWQIEPSEIWCVLGTNGSGKGTLAALLSGEQTPDKGSIEARPVRVSSLSFESQQKLYEDELYKDDTDFLDQIDKGTCVEQLLFEYCSDPDQPEYKRIYELASKLDLIRLFQRGYRQLSSGESRKVLLLRELGRPIDLFILDEPYEGLDAQSIIEMNAVIHQIASHQQVFLLVNRSDDVPDWATHVAVLHQGKLLAQGSDNRKQVLEEFRQLSQLYGSADGSDIVLPPAKQTNSYDSAPLVKMEDTQVVYGDRVQFSHFNWQLNQGEHSLIRGPNGSGKSTLLQLISGDHPQCYQNHIEVFGIKRGTGESVWDIKKHIGIVSSSLHRDYRVTGNALTVVISGLYDSIGLYTKASLADKQLAMQWLKLMGMEHLANSPFRKLSFGQQRLILIARGLIKQPRLLILDEPTLGLDDMNRHLVLHFIEKLAALKQTTILFVSHRTDEQLPLFKHEIAFEPDTENEGSFVAISKKHGD